MLRMASLLICGSLIISTPALAEWVFLAESSAGDKFFIETSSIRKNADERQVWILQDRHRPDTEGSRSAKILMEFDCRRDQYRIRQVMAHEGSMGKGERGSVTHQLTGWAFTVPDTPYWAIQRRVC